MEQVDVLIVGGGAAGISAAKAVYNAGCKSVLLVDYRPSLGGILLQCVHRGFGVGMNGKEYIAKLLSGFPEGIACYLDTTVLTVSEEKKVKLSGPNFGEREVGFQQLILATGAREIPMGALLIAGTRPKGVYTAGQMQEMMNLHGYVPEGPTVVLGSGDLGLIMAEQLAEAGLSVTLVEKKDACGGMLRNQRRLRQYPISLYCGATIVEVFGEKRLAGVMLSNGKYLPCKTLLIAAGLCPDRELIHGLRKANWLHICGNCNTVHPMVEAVVDEGNRAGLAAFENLRGRV